MSDDYSIVIRLDPSQPVAGAQKVTDAVAKIEKQSFQAQKAMDAVALGTKQAQKEMEAAAAKQLASFKQGAGLVAQGFELLNQKLGITDSAVGQVISSGVKFGQLGAQIAGPWGAAIGAIGGALLDLGKHFGAFHDEIEKIEAKIRNQQAYALRGAIALLKVNEAFTAQRDVIKRAREDLDAYNGTLATLDRTLDSVSNKLPGVMGMLTGKLVGYDPWDAAASKKRIEKAMAPRTPIATPDWDKISVMPLTADDADAISGGRMNQGLFPNGFGKLADNSGGFTSADAQRVLDQRLAEAEAWKKIAANTREWNLELEQSQERMKRLAGFTQPLQNELVNLFTTGEFGWRRMIDSMLADAARLATIKLFSGTLFGPSLEDGLVRGGAPGIMPLAQASAPYYGGGNMFRAIPRESPTFAIPNQMREAAAVAQPAASGDVSVRVVDQRDPRALAESPGLKRAVRAVILDNPTLIRSLMR